MKNVSTLKSNSKTDSPKTPGGISKSLLTPCRRLGLSRNWRKNGPSPFVSPLASSAEIKVEKRDDTPPRRDTKKRKQRCDEDESKEESLLTPISLENSQDNDSEVNRATIDINDLESTPSRNVSIPRKKKSKTLASHITGTGSIDIESPKSSIECVEINDKIPDMSKENNTIQSCNQMGVTTPIRPKSKSKVKSTLAINTSKVVDEIKGNISSKINDVKTEKGSESSQLVNETLKDSERKSPDNLTKECIVVLQKKIFKDLDKRKQRDEWQVKKSVNNPVSQALFDSDTDDVPLSTLNKKEKTCKPHLEPLDEDDDFAENTKVKVKKLVDKTTSVGGLISDTNKKKTKPKKECLSTKIKPKHDEDKVLNSKPSSQSSIDDDEDFVIDNRRTILIRKSYDKVSKPTKAKSTGSISQKDIDDLKAKIEVKKKLLLAKAVTKDTEELRGLIKKWQRGCQDALMELMELMKTKFSDKPNMDYSEMLQMLKIPASLVGYDEENDCFGTPTDENIILSKFNDT